jgi:hypothetical protein
MYVPVVLLTLWQGLRRPGEGFSKALVRMLPRLILPALLALAYGIYNAVRFGNPFEFGHTYLPEHMGAEHGQFSIAYMGQNLRNILRMPYLEDGQLRFPFFFGFAFFIANPLFLLAAWRLISGAIKRRLVALDWVILACAALHFCLLLLHKSFGAWQFGTRYLVDTLPLLGWFVLRAKKGPGFLQGLVMLWAVAFNIYGGLLFHLG